VRECAVVGVPDARRGETAKAFVVPRARRGAVEADLRAYCGEHLAGYKVPRLWEFVPELPTSATGKVLKRLLRGRPPGGP
jgi:long-chain acyl-CoA synthetase